MNLFNDSILVSSLVTIYSFIFRFIFIFTKMNNQDASMVNSSYNLLNIDNIKVSYANGEYKLIKPQNLSNVSGLRFRNFKAEMKNSFKQSMPKLKYEIWPTWYSKDNTYDESKTSMIVLDNNYKDTSNIYKSSNKPFLTKELDWQYSYDDSDLLLFNIEEGIKIAAEDLKEYINDSDYKVAEKLHLNYNKSKTSVEDLNLTIPEDEPIYVSNKLYGAYEYFNKAINNNPAFIATNLIKEDNVWKIADRYPCLDGAYFYKPLPFNSTQLWDEKGKFIEPYEVIGNFNYQIQNDRPKFECTFLTETWEPRKFVMNVDSSNYNTSYNYQFQMSSYHHMFYTISLTNKTSTGYEFYLHQHNTRTEKEHTFMIKNFNISNPPDIYLNSNTYNASSPKFYTYGIHRNAHPNGLCLIQMPNVALGYTQEEAARCAYLTDTIITTDQEENITVPKLEIYYDPNGFASGRSCQLADKVNASFSNASAFMLKQFYYQIDEQHKLQISFYNNIGFLCEYLGYDSTETKPNDFMYLIGMCLFSYHGYVIFGGDGKMVFKTRTEIEDEFADQSTIASHLYKFGSLSNRAAAIGTNDSFTAWVVNQSYQTNHITLGSNTSLAHLIHFGDNHVRALTTNGYPNGVFYGEARLRYSKYWEETQKLASNIYGQLQNETFLNGLTIDDKTFATFDRDTIDLIYEKSIQGYLVPSFFTQNYQLSFNIVIKTEPYIFEYIVRAPKTVPGTYSLSLLPSSAIMKTISDRAYTNLEYRALLTFKNPTIYLYSPLISNHDGLLFLQDEESQVEFKQCQISNNTEYIPIYIRDVTGDNIDKETLLDLFESIYLAVDWL